nr:hypothetical protein [Frankia sp. CiP3]
MNRAAGESEGEEQREGGEGVGDVVQGVPEQRHRPGQHDDDGLQGRGQAETGQADQQGAAPGGVGFQGVIDLVGAVVAVPPDRL